jgi:hypothetical protein
MIDQEGAGATVLRMTPEDRARYVAKVEEHGRVRAKNFGRDFHDDDFLMGAAVAFEVFATLGAMPASWVFGLMAGESPLRPEGERGPRTARCAAGGCTETQRVYGNADVPEGWLGLLTGRSEPLAFCSPRHLRRFAETF